MAGPNFGILDPDAFFKGAANTNALMSQFARQKAGQLLAKGDKSGAVRELQQDGDLEAAGKLQFQLDEQDERVRSVAKEERARQTEMLIDVTTTLEHIRQKDGDAAVLPAFQQLVPMFKNMGATDEDLAPYADALQRDPENTLRSIRALAQSQAKQYTLSPGAERRSELGGELIAKAPLNPIVRSVGPGSSLITVDPSQMQQDGPVEPQVAPSAASGLPPEAAAMLVPGKVKKFRNGQSWTIGEDGKTPVRVE